jgi:hypothetical protein
MKAPVTMASVLAAFRSRLASNDTCFFLLCLDELLKRSISADF